MSRSSKRPTENPDERSSWNRWAPLGIIAGAAGAIIVLIALLELLSR